MDTKGRLVVPKEIRDAARITAPAALVVEAEGEGRVVLYSLETKLTKARRIAKKKLTGWVEEEHEADRLVERVVKEKPK